MAADGWDASWQTGAGATAARMPRCSAQSTTVVQRACRHSAAHWGLRESGHCSRTSDRCRCRAMCPPSPGSSREARCWEVRSESVSGYVNRRRSVVAMAVVGAGAMGGRAMAADSAVGADSVNRKHQEHVGATDPYVWLEDIHGAKPLEWVKAQNARSTAILQADPRYQKDYDGILGG